VTSECEKILSCRITETVYGMFQFLIADFLSVLLHYLDASLSCTQTVPVSQFSLFFNLIMEIDFNPTNKHLFSERESQGQFLAPQYRPLMMGQFSALQVARRTPVFLVFCGELPALYSIQLAVSADLTQPKGALKAQESHRCSQMASALPSPSRWQHMARSLCCQRPL